MGDPLLLLSYHCSETLICVTEETDRSRIDSKENRVMVVESSSCYKLQAPTQFVIMNSGPSFAMKIGTFLLVVEYHSRDIICCTNFNSTQQRSSKVLDSCGRTKAKKLTVFAAVHVCSIFQRNGRTSLAAALTNV
ncbi:unnamed protein product [Sphenostylis stenocarpa]|uniref:Uncharacterized protein n=1 Tax=Sphenostylis stenocarpa TaxID=92480 RepID=A0AA86T322_9FABA|nr:unnamed protein product [Sphenostylis stenocarpa]